MPTEYDGKVKIGTELDTTELKKDLEKLSDTMQNSLTDADKTAKKTADSITNKQKEVGSSVKRTFSEMATASGVTADQLKADIDAAAKEYQTQGMTISESYKRVYKELGIQSGQAMQEQIDAAQAVELANKQASEEVEKAAKKAAEEATNVTEKSAEDMAKATEEASKKQQASNEKVERSFEEIATASGKTVTELQKDADRIAQKYQRQGDTISESYKKAYKEMGVSSEEAMNKQIHSAERVKEAQEKALSSITRMIKVGLVAGAAAITAAATSGLKFNSEMEKYVANFSTMMNDSEKAVEHLNDLKEFAAKTPLGLSELAEASQTIQAFGIGVDDVMPSLKMLGDISLGNKDKFSSLALVFGQVKSQGKLMGQDLLELVA